MFSYERRDRALTSSFKSTDAAGSGVDSGRGREVRKITIPRPLIRCRDILPFGDLKGCQAESLRELLKLCVFHVFF